VPTKAWLAEQAKITTKRFELCDEYYRLRDETKNVEV